jgi:hypothetical protein
LRRSCSVSGGGGVGRARGGTVGSILPGLGVRVLGIVLAAILACVIGRRRAR